MFEKLKSFYSVEENMSRFETIVLGRDRLTLRAVDHYVCRDKSSPLFCAYRNLLKVYQKSRFDAFCRRKRILFRCAGREILTTIGQLNFFRFAIERGVLEAARDDIARIEREMNEHVSQTREQRKRQREGAGNVVVTKRERANASVEVTIRFGAS